MSQQTIGVGTTANDGTGDPARTAFQKCNANFTELYNADTAFTATLALKAPLISPTLVTPNLGVATATSINGVTVTNGGSGALTVTGAASVSGVNTGDQDLSNYATNTALALKAPLASPAMTGTPTAPTAVLGTNTTQLATAAFVQAAVAALVNAAPGALDTLKELADAIGDDANYAATITAALAGKQPFDSDLTAIAALATTTYGRALLTLANAAALRTAVAYTPPQDVSVSYTANGDAYYVAPEAMTLAASPAVGGTGTLAYTKALAADTTSFSAASLPVTLAAGDVLKITVSGINTYKAVTLRRSA